MDNGTNPPPTSLRSFCYPPLPDEMRIEGLELLQTYLSRMHNMVSRYIATWTIMALSLDVYKFLG